MPYLECEIMSHILNAYMLNVDLCVTSVFSQTYKLLLSIMPLPLTRRSSHALQTILNTTNSPHNKTLQISGSFSE